MFDAKKVKNDCVRWIKEWFDANGRGCNAVVGISGGKDSSVVAALCSEALGKEGVIGVIMPNGEQEDINMAYRLIDHLGIKRLEVNIKDAYDSILKSMRADNGGFVRLTLLTKQTLTNLPARIRMATLYAVSQTVNGRVANTCNLSEDWVGYSTRYGDSAGDFSPLANLTVSEVKAIGYELGLPEELIEKTPSDGLCGKTDEDNLGFTYNMLDRYIRTGKCKDKSVKEKIDAMHSKNLFKLQPMPSFTPKTVVEKKNPSKGYLLALLLYIITLMLQLFTVNAAGIDTGSVFYWLILLHSFMIFEIGIFARSKMRS